MITFNRRSNILTKVFYELFIICYAIVKVLMAPGLVILCIPIYIWRTIVIWLAKCFRSDLNKIVSARSSVMAVDEWKKKPKCNLVVQIGLEGQLNWEDLLQEITDKVIEHRNAEGELLHPELSQYYEKWMGFTFWRWEENFKISNHFRYWNPDDLEAPFSGEDLMKYETELIHNAFPAKRSPWEVVYFPVYKPLYDTNPNSPKSLIFFRLHHGIADGYSLLNLLLKEVCQLHEHEYAVPHYPTKSFCRKIMDNVTFLIKAPYDSAKQHIECTDNNIFRIPRNQLIDTWYQVRSKPIPLDYLKEIKNMYKVSMTALIVAGLTGGIRNYCLKKRKSLPFDMHCVAPFPVPGHTKKLRNFYSFAFIKFPVGIEDTKQRLLMVEKYLKNIKDSTSPQLNFMQLPILGGLCNGLIKSYAKNLMSTALLSNFPGPFKQCTFMNKPVTELGFTGGLLRGNQGMGFAMLSYLGSMTIRAVGCKSFFPSQEDVEELMAEIVNEFHILKHLGEA